MRPRGLPFRRRAATWALVGIVPAAILSVAAGGMPAHATSVDAWSAAQNISAAGWPGSFPEIAASADGTKATAVWHRDNGSNYVAPAASATISGKTATWSAPVNISTPGRNAYEPKIALSTDGTRATAVWHRSATGGAVVQSASATISGNTATWSTPTDISASGQQAAYPEIALSADGTRAIASWLRWVDGSFTHFTATAAISGTLGTWAPAQTLSITGSTANYLRTAISADGTQVTALWCESDGSNQVVHSASATVSASGVGWGPVSRISATGQDASLPELAPSADGTVATAVWLRSNGADAIVQSASGLFEAPAITSGKAAAATSGAAMTNVTVTATGTPAPAISASGALPPGVTFTDHNDGTATVTGTPTTAGTYPLTITAANGIGPSATQAFTLTVAAAPEAAKSAQIPSNGCVRAPRSLPRAGTVPLTKTGCRTSAGQWVGAIVTSAARSARGKARSPRVSLTCVGAGKKAPAAIPTGYGDGSKSCPRGAVALKKTAGKGTVTITWLAPANATHDAYRLSRAYPSK